MKSQTLSGVLSLVGSNLKQHAPASPATRQIAISLTGAFLVVMAAGFALNIASAALDATSRPSTSEPVAYQSGQYIRSELSRGYVGSYR